MIRTIGRLLTCVTFAAMSVAAGGCTEPASKADHHLEHVIPGHKPESFAEAVAEIAERGESLADHPLEGKKLAELSDIINWLPELAADSDLRRQQWERVQQTSRELSDIVSQTGRETVTSSDHESWIRSVSELQELVPEAGDVGPERSLHTHSHDHWHDDHGETPATETDMEQ